MNDRTIRYVYTFHTSWWYTNYVYIFTHLFTDYRVVSHQHAQYVVETNRRPVQVGQVIRRLQEGRYGHEKINDRLALAGIPFDGGLQVVEQGIQRFFGRHVHFFVSQHFFTKLKYIRFITVVYRTSEICVIWKNKLNIVFFEWI